MSVPYLETGSLADLRRIRFIPGAPPGVCAGLITIRKGEQKTCEECGQPITTKHRRAWYCDRNLIDRKKKGLAYWHYNCLKQPDT